MLIENPSLNLALSLSGAVRGGAGRVPREPRGGEGKGGWVSLMTEPLNLEWNMLAGVVPKIPEISVTAWWHRHSSYDDRGIPYILEAHYFMSQLLLVFRQCRR